MDLTAAQVTDLVGAARRARRRAYVPYSDFASGAAVLTSDGSIHIGALVENLVFGLAMCAERVALFGAVTRGNSPPVALALVAPSTAGHRTYPCGPCLQVAVELGGRGMVVVAAGSDDVDPDVTTIGDLAPGLPARRNPGAGHWA